MKGMVQLRIILDADRCWPDLDGVDVVEAKSIEVARMIHGTTSGASAVMIRFNMPDGTTVIGQTTMALFMGAAAAFKGAEARDAGPVQ